MYRQFEVNVSGVHKSSVTLCLYHSFDHDDDNVKTAANEHISCTILVFRLRMCAVSLALPLIVHHLVLQDCGADCAKFQKSELEYKFNKKALERPYTSKHSWGKTYGEHKRHLEFSHEQYRELKKYAEEIGIFFTASGMDEVCKRYWKDRVQLMCYWFLLSQNSSYIKSNTKYLWILTF